MTKMTTVRPVSQRELLLSVSLKDCDVQTKRGSGKGGQHRNKRDTAVRIVHRDSGAVGESCDERSQLQNKRTAFRRMAEHPKFKVWLNRQIWFRNRDPEAEVKEWMQPRHLRVEGRETGTWAPLRQENR